MFIPPEIWVILLFSGQMLDMLTTRWGLTHFPVEEMNHFGKWLLGRFGFKGLVVKSIMAGAVLCVVGFIMEVELIWLVGTVVSWVPVAWNAYVLSNAKAGS